MTQEYKNEKVSKYMTLDISEFVCGHEMREREREREREICFYTEILLKTSPKFARNKKT